MKSWWADSMKSYRYLPNVQDLVWGGKTPCERRIGEPSKGPMLPFGSIIEYIVVLPKTSQDFVPIVVPGFSTENLDAPEIHARRPNAKEITAPKNGENFTFPIAGTVKLSARDQVPAICGRGQENHILP